MRSAQTRLRCSLQKKIRGPQKSILPDEKHSFMLFVHQYAVDRESLKPIYLHNMLWANSADDKVTIFFLFFLGIRLRDFTHIVSLGDNLHKLSKPLPSVRSVNI